MGEQVSIELRQYQKEILNKLCESLKQHNKVLLSLPTGAGKTFMMMAWAQHMAKKNKRTVMVVDREELIDQAFEIDQSISILKANSKYKFDANKLVQIVMLQTVYRRQELLLNIQADYIFFDEIHNYVEGQMFASLCDCMNKAKIIGVSATVVDAKGYLLEGFEDVVGDLQTKDLIDAGFLVKPIYYVPQDFNLDLSMVRISNGDYDVQDLDSIMINSNCAQQIFDNWKTYGSNRKTIAFCSSIRQAMFLDGFFKARKIKSACVHSQCDNRSDIIKQYKHNKIDILFNVNILTAGFNDRSTSCIIFAAPTRVLRKYLQQAGRGLRTFTNKKDCIMLDCADVVRQHGFCDDIRFFKFKEKIRNESPYKDCPECGSIVSINAHKCPYCGYEFDAVEQTKGSVPKKELLRLQKAFSMQQQLKQQISDLVDIRGYKQGYKWYLFLDCLKTKKPSESSIQFFKRKLTKIQKIQKRGYKLASLKYN